MRENDSKIDPRPCCECGGKIALTFYDDVKRLLIEHCMCFSCNFWRKYMERKDDGKCIRADGKHYIAGNQTERTEPKYRGFGGDRWRISFFDGRVVETVDLWHQGTIPDHFRERMPDNAKLENIEMQYRREQMAQKKDKRP